MVPDGDREPYLARVRRLHPDKNSVPLPFLPGFAATHSSPGHSLGVTRSCNERSADAQVAIVGRVARGFGPRRPKAPVFLGVYFFSIFFLSSKKLDKLDKRGSAH